jgi:signal transduction histidine kinase
VLLFQTNGNLVLSLIATGIVAVAFAPLRNLVQRGVDRLMYGERDEPYRVLTRLGQQLEAALEPTTALTVAVETIGQALKLPYVAIALRQAGALHTVAAYGAAQSPISRYPLTYAGEAVGELVVAPRAPNEALNPADQHLLWALARQIGVATKAASLAARLELARLRLVTERGEARRQLGSDLHDSVGHQLVDLTRQVEQAMRTVVHDPTRTHRLLADINQQLVILTQHVRMLAHQLFPPELALLGLIGALRERAQTHPTLRIQLDAPERLPPLPAEIETAVYYIALEALTNVEKHARASMCIVRLAMVYTDVHPGEGVLELTIDDDGIGVSPKRLAA